MKERRVGTDWWKPGPPPKTGYFWVMVQRERGPLLGYYPGYETIYLCEEESGVEVKRVSHHIGPLSPPSEPIKVPDGHKKANTFPWGG